MDGLPNVAIPEAHVPQTEGSQIGDHGSCGIVERPDQHCGDDLMLSELRSRTRIKWKLWSVIQLFYQVGTSLPYDRKLLKWYLSSYPDGKAGGNAFGGS